MVFFIVYIYFRVAVTPTYHAGTDGEGLDKFDLRAEDTSVDLPVARVRGEFVAEPVIMNS